MEWIKKGHIFNPQDYSANNSGREFAQSPQALVFPDRVRIYFSTRTADKSGKYLSQIAFVEYDKQFKSLLHFSSHEVISLGDLGCFDEHGIFPLNVLRHEDLVLGYSCGWSRRVSVSVETGIGLAISHDSGQTFQKVGAGPVLTSSLREPCLVGDGFVKVINGTFHMWYIFGSLWKKFDDCSPPDRVYKIGHATSSDGIVWHKEEGRKIISDALGEDESQALPTVIEIDKRFHMFFCFRQSFDFRQNKSRGYKIGHAWSDDLKTWIRDDSEMALEGTPGEWDSDMQCYPHVFEMDGNVYMLYNGNEFGRYGFGLAELVS